MTNIISMVQGKGGSGKTTAALVLATTLAAAGQRVSIIDADPYLSVFCDWARGDGDGAAVVKFHGIRVCNASPTRRKEPDIRRIIQQESHHSGFIIVDLEGTANTDSALAVSISDLVIVPIKLSKMDVSRARHAIELVAAQRKVSGKKIMARMLISQCSPVIRTPAHKLIERQLVESKAGVMQTRMVLRSPFEDLCLGGQTLETMDGNLAKVHSAKENALAFTNEVISVLKSKGQSRRRRETVLEEA